MKVIKKKPLVTTRKNTEILDAAETVLGYSGFDRTVYGNKKSTGDRK